MTCTRIADVVGEQPGCGERQARIVFADEHERGTRAGLHVSFGGEHRVREAIAEIGPLAPRVFG